MRKTKTIIDKPWGHEEIWAQTSRYAGKILVIKGGHRLSRQYHNVKEETILVQEGVLTCETGPQRPGDKVEIDILTEGSIFHVPPGTIHRFCAENGDVRLLEVSTSEIQDVVRLEDDYRRIDPEDMPITPPQSGK